MTLLLALVAGGGLGIAHGRLTRAIDALTGLGRTLDDGERGLVLDAVAEARDLLDWVVVLVEADPRAGELWSLPAIRRAGPGPIEATMTAFVDARYYLKQAGRSLNELADQGRHPVGEGREMLRGLTTTIGTALDWIAILANGTGVTDTALADLLT
jgi:hypothetical protein